MKKLLVSFWFQGMLITVFVLQLPSLESEKEAEICHYIFMLLPTYT